MHKVHITLILRFKLSTAPTTSASVEVNTPSSLILNYPGGFPGSPVVKTPRFHGPGPGSVPGSPVVKTPWFHGPGPGSVLGWGTRIP